MPARLKQSKYNRKYSMQLTRGLRKNGMSIPEVCQKWGISIDTYYNWINTIAEFRRAALHGERDVAAWWMETLRKAATGEIKGNASIITFAVKNIKSIGWTDKVEVAHTDETIQKITINVLPSAPPKPLTKTPPKVIEHNVEDGEIIEG